MSRSVPFLLLALSLELFLSGQAGAQQPGRLLAYAPSSTYCFQPSPLPPLFCCAFYTFPFRFSLFEVDPGSPNLTEIPINPPTVPHVPGSGTWVGAYDKVGGRLFIYDTIVGGMLYTIDAGTGAMLHSVLVGPGLSNLHFESSSQRLLAMMPQLGSNSLMALLVQVDVVTGVIIQLSAPLNSGVTLPQNAYMGLTTLDDAGHRLILSGGSAYVILDTLTGTQIGSFTPQTPPPPFVATAWDPIQSKIVAFALQGFVGLLTIDPATGVVTTLGLGLPFPGWGIGSRPIYALDVQRRLYHIVGGSIAFGSPFGLSTFDLVTGQRIADPGLATLPAIPGPIYSVPLLHSFIFIDTVHPPQTGRVSFAPTNVLGPAGALTVQFEALGHGTEWYFPFVSCTTGSYAVPSSNLALSLAFDPCSALFFSSASSAFFNLTPTNGALGDILSPSGTAQGSVMLPASTPTGLNFDLFISFATLNMMGQWTGVHGIGIVHINT